jgi:excinuclease UvrABC nuclease subunit
MKYIKLIPMPENKAHFHFASYKTIPVKAGCYVLTTFDADILYIGLSENLFNRFQQHLNNPKKVNPTRDGKAFWFYFTIYNPNNLRNLERTWLNQYVAMHGRRPILNKVDSPIN